MTFCSIAHTITYLKRLFFFLLTRLYFIRLELLLFGYVMFFSPYRFNVQTLRTTKNKIRKTINTGISSITRNQNLINAETHVLMTCSSSAGLINTFEWTKSNVTLSYLNDLTIFSCTLAYTCISLFHCLARFLCKCYCIFFFFLSTLIMGWYFFFFVQMINWQSINPWGSSTEILFPK